MEGIVSIYFDLTPTLAHQWVQQFFHLPYRKVL